MQQRNRRPSKPISPEDAAAWARDLCSRAEYASGEILEKLVGKGLSLPEAREIVDGLVEERFIDDERFARAFARDKVLFARWGKQKVAAALYRKKVPRHAVEAAFDDIDPAEYIRILREALAAKARSIGADPADLDFATRQRLYRFAASRGFDSDSIARAINDF